MLKFPLLPIVDESEATLKAQGIDDMKEIMAILSESIGIELPGGAFDPFVKAGTVIPVQFAQVLSTAETGQQEIVFTLFHGKKARISENHRIGKVSIVGVPSSPAGVPRIELKLQIQRNGDLLVSARELASGKPLELKQNVR